MRHSILERVLVRRGIRFPVGSYVSHPDHGTGLVLARLGNIASVEFVETQMTPAAHLRPEELPPDVDPELLLAAGTETRWTVDVNVSDLAPSLAPIHWTETFNRKAQGRALDTDFDL